MTITRSLRPLAAAALAAGIALPGAASASHGSGGPEGPATHRGGHHASSDSGHQRHRVDGVVQTISGTTAPAMLTVKAGSTTITVAVSARTKLLRGHGGRSSLAEFTPGDPGAGDLITAIGSFETGSTTFDARQIKDLSIAYTHVVGTVAGVWTGGVTLSVARHGNPRSPYPRGQVQVTLSPSTKVISGSVTLTASAVNWTQTPPLHVQVTGLYDAANPALPTLRAAVR